MYIAKPSHAVCAFLHSWIGICRKKWYFKAIYIHIQLQIRVQGLQSLCIKWTMARGVIVHCVCT